MPPEPTSSSTRYGPMRRSSRGRGRSSRGAGFTAVLASKEYCAGTGLPGAPPGTPLPLPTPPGWRRSTVGTGPCIFRPAGIGPGTRFASARSVANGEAVGSLPPGTSPESVVGPAGSPGDDGDGEPAGPTTDSGEVPGGSDPTAS